MQIPTIKGLIIVGKTDNNQYFLALPSDPDTNIGAVRFCGGNGYIDNGYWTWSGFYHGSQWGDKVVNLTKNDCKQVVNDFFNYFK